MQFLLVANLRSGVLESGRSANFEQFIEQEKAHARKAYLEGSLRQIWLRTPDLASNTKSGCSRDRRS